MNKAKIADEKSRQKSSNSDNEKKKIELISRMETLQVKYSGLRHDLRSLLDEREDLVQERDAYKCKVHRLNHAMSALLKSEGFKTVDLDWLIAENRFLQESLAQVKEEKELSNEMGRRYKRALEKNKAAVVAKHSSKSSKKIQVKNKIENLP